MSQAKKLAEDAKGEKLKKGEIKVGLAGKDLVFRIKYKNKVGMDAHYKKDVLFIKDFRKVLTDRGQPTDDPEFIDDGTPEEDTIEDSTDLEEPSTPQPTGQNPGQTTVPSQSTTPKPTQQNQGSPQRPQTPLLPGVLVVGQPPKLTVGWWTATRGTFQENGLEQALAQFSQKLPLLRKPNNTVYMVLVKLIQDVINKAEAVEQAVTAPGDKQIMGNFVQAATAIQDDAIRRQTAYGEAIENHAKEVLDQMTQNIDNRERMHESAKTQIEEAINKQGATGQELAAARIKLTAMDDAIRKIQTHLGLINKAWSKPKGGIDPKDLAGHRGFNSRSEHATALVRTMQNDSVDLHRRLQPVVVSFAQQQTRSQEYLQELGEIRAIYQKVIRDLTPIVQRTAQAANLAGPVLTRAQQAASAQDAGRIGTDAERVLKGLEDIKDEAANVFSSVRQQGEGATRLKASKLTMEDKTFFFGSGLFEDAKKVNLQINDAAAVGFLQLEQAMDALQANIGDLGQAAAQVEKVRGRAEELQRPVG